jgi:hypothetical protein
MPNVCHNINARRRARSAARPSVCNTAARTAVGAGRQMLLGGSAAPLACFRSCKIQHELGFTWLDPSLPPQLPAPPSLSSTREEEEATRQSPPFPRPADKSIRFFASVKKL